MSAEFVQVTVWCKTRNGPVRTRMAVTVDYTKLAAGMAQRAFNNKSGKSQLAHGAIVVQHSPDPVR